MTDTTTLSQSTVAELAAFNAITDDEGLAQADALHNKAKDVLKAIDEAHDDDINFAHQEHKRLISEKKKVYDPVDKEARRIKQLMAGYKAEQERKAREERLRLESEARKAEEERKLSEAIAAEAAGDKDEADLILAEPVILAPAYSPPPPKTQTRFRTNIKVEVTDPDAVPRDLCSPNLVKIRDRARALGEKVQIPGVRVWKETV